MSFWKRLGVGALMAFRGVQAINGLRIGKHKIQIREVSDLERVVTTIRDAVKPTGRPTKH